MATGPVLYSTNVFLKFHIAEQFLGNIHYVWCSEAFDSTKQGHYSGSALVAATSDPCAIYRDLQSATLRPGGDRHCSKIIEQRASFSKLAVQWRDAGRITSDIAEEIIYMANTAEPLLWRPLVYVIPRALVERRMKRVAPDRRASIGVEHIIEDLDRSEFDIIEM